MVQMIGTAGEIAGQSLFQPRRQIPPRRDDIQVRMNQLMTKHLIESFLKRAGNTDGDQASLCESVDTLSVPVRLETYRELLIKAGLDSSFYPPDKY